MPRRLFLVGVLAYGALNAILYAALLPLWDGFDEPFHYAYVSRLWRERRWQTLGQATLSAEIWESLALAPGSYLVHRNIPTVIPFNDYFARTDAERAELRRKLEHIDPKRAAEPGGGVNYEAQQAPLAYIVLAPFDILWRNSTLIVRILLLRLLCGLLSVLTTGWLVYQLGGQFGLAERWRLTAVYLALSSQVFYATTAHVANDWLAVPLFTGLIVAGIALFSRPTAARAGLFAIVLAAGLLTKAYFLAVLPFAAGLALVLCLRRQWPWLRAAAISAAPLAIAGAWYARNLLLYHDLSGIQQTSAGGPALPILQAASQMPWAKSLATTATTSLWFGNSSATLFSSKTVAVMLLLLAIAGICYAATARRRGWPAAERITAAAILSYCAGLVYSAVLHFWTTHAGMISPAPWYTQLLFPPGLCLAMLGLARAGRAGEVVRITMLALWAYVLSATYFAKLIPLYAGYTAERVHLSDLWRWYRTSFAQADRTLATTALAPGGVWMLAAIVICGAVALAVALGRTRDA